MEYIDKSRIIQVSLLTRDEYEEVISTIPGIPVEMPVGWWLSTPHPLRNYPNRVAMVDHDGTVVYTLTSAHMAIRPVIKIKDFVVTPGTKYQVGNMTYTAIDKDKLLANFICETQLFDKHSNKFETSFIKRYIESQNFIKAL